MSPSQETGDAPRGGATRPETPKTPPAAGLTREEAEARLRRFGPNTLQEGERVSALGVFLRQFKNTLTVILLAAVALSAVVGEILDAAVIGVIVLFCAVLGFVQEYRSERALQALGKMLAPMVRALRDGEETEIERAAVVPGDVLLLEAGDVVPADALALEAHALRADEASLTGESVPTGKRAAASVDAPTSERSTMVFAGTVLTAGRGRVLVTATGMDTELGGIAKAVARVEEAPTPLEKRTAEIGKWLGLTALAVCLIVAGAGLLREDFAQGLSMRFVINMAMFSISLAVAAVPEALAAIVTGALAVGMRRMARENALVRHMPAVETLGCATVICTDKTGTLTTGKMALREIRLSHRIDHAVRPDGGPGEASSENGETAPVDARLRDILTTGHLCNDARLTRRDGEIRVLGDPTEAALTAAAAKVLPDIEDTAAALPRIEEIPFSSERKRMSTIHRDGDGLLVCVKGAPEIVLARSAALPDASGERPLTDADRERILTAAEDMAARGVRVLAAARKRLPVDAPLDEDTVENGLVFLGLAGLTDPPRPEAVQAIAACRRVGVRPVMITGDHMVTAKAAARELGILGEDGLALSGADLAGMDQEALVEIVDRVDVYARVSPLDKLKIVSAWKARGEVTVMTGDGVNDAPALKKADIGVAMGLTGTDVAKQAADMVLLDDNFASIVKAVELGRGIYDNIKKYLTYLLRCNITETAVIGGVVLALGPHHLPLLPAAILYINMATDGLPALALGAAPPDPDIMERPPRDPKESVFSPDVRLFLVLGALIEIPFFFATYLFSAHDPVLARTRLFFLFIIVESIIALNFRSMKFGVLAAPPHKWLVAAVLWEALLLAVLVHVPTIRRAFGVALPPLADLAAMFCFGVVVFLSMEGGKVLLRRRERRRADAAQSP